MMVAGLPDEAAVQGAVDIVTAFRDFVIPPAVDDARAFFTGLVKAFRQAFRARLVVLWDNNVYTGHLVRLAADPHDPEGLGAPAVPLGACLAGLAVERSDIVQFDDLARGVGTRHPPAAALVDKLGAKRLISLPVSSPFNSQFVCLVADLYLEGATELPGRTSLSLLSQVLGLCLDYVVYQIDHRLRSAVEQAMAGAGGISGLFERVYPSLERETGCLSAALFTRSPATGKLVLETSLPSAPSAARPKTQVESELADQVIKRRATAMVATPLPEHGITTLMFAPIMTVSGEPLGMLQCLGPVEHEASFSTVDMHALETLARSLGPCVERFMRVRSGSSLTNVVKQVSTGVSRAYETEELLQQTIDTTVGALNAEVGSIYLRDSDTDTFVLRASTGHCTDLRGKARYTVGDGLTGAVAGGAVLNLKSREDVLAHPAFKGKYDKVIWGDAAVGCQTFLGVPIRAEGRVIGVMKAANLKPSVEHPDPYFTDEDVETTQVLSAFLAYAIQNSRHKELAARLYDSLAGSSIAIEQAESEDDAIMAAMVALEESGFANAMLSLYSEKTRRIEGVVASGPSWTKIVEMTKRDIDGDDILARVLHAGEAEFIADSRTHPYCDKTAVEAANVRAQYVLPLRLGNELIGTLQVDMGDRNAIDEDDALVLKGFASHLAVAVSRLRSIRKTAELAEEVMSGSRFIVAETLSSLAVHSAGHIVDRMLEDLRTELKREDIRENKFLVKTMRGWEDQLQSAEEDLERALGLVTAPDSLSGPTDVHSQVQQAIDTWFSFVRASGVRIKRQLEAVHSTCDIPTHAFREIVSVMLVNSIQAHAKRIHVETYNQDDVSVTPTYSVAQALCLDFADDGVGLTTDDPEGIFQPTYTTKPSKYGTGLGLFIARRLARTGGGDLVVVGKGVGGKGVTFRLVLRVARKGGKPDE